MDEKVTLITTVKNEEQNIEAFFESISKQTKKPDEIVIVDAYSTDTTVLKIRNEMSKKLMKYQVLRKKGNRSVGRNTAIKNSNNSLVAVTDVGCILDKHWLERISKPFKDRSVDVIAGFYKPITNSIFEKCLATYTCVMGDKLDTKNFLPSSRSVAFRKKVWEKVGGYPENLNTCEDLVFDEKLKKAGMKFSTIPNAIVYWHQRKNIVEAAQQLYSYAVGDGRARYFRPQTPLLYLRYFFGISFLTFILFSKSYFLFAILCLLFALYLLWSVLKNYRYVKVWQAFLILPMLQITSDICVLLGTSIGLLRTL